MLLAGTPLAAMPLCGGDADTPFAANLEAGSRLTVTFDRIAAPGTIAPASADDIRVEVLYDGLSVDAFTNIDVTVT